MLRSASFAAVLWLLSWPCYAQAPSPSLTDAEQNVAFAVSQLCAPYVLDRLDKTNLPFIRDLVQEDGVDAASKEKRERVGVAGNVHVVARQNGGVRSCDISAEHVPPSDLRKAFLDAIAQRPEGFAPTVSKYFPGRWAAEDRLCASATGARPGAFVLLSLPYDQERDKIPTIFTLADGPTRGAECDHDGVKMNFRTLITPEALAAQAAALDARRASVLAALNLHANPHLYVAPRIPSKMRETALRRSSELSADQDLLGVVDETIAHNGNIGVYFYGDGIINVPPASAARFIPYAYIRATPPTKGAFVVSFGNAQVEANLIGKDNMIALVQAAAEAAK